MSVESFYRYLGISDLDQVARPCWVCSRRARGGADLVLCIDSGRGSWHCYRCGGGGGPLEAALALGLPPADAEAAMTAHELAGDAEREDSSLPSEEVAQAPGSDAPDEPDPDPTNAAVRSGA